MVMTAAQKRCQRACGSADESYWSVIIITIIVFGMFMREVH